MHIISGTSGNPLPAEIIRKSKIRAFFNLPSLHVVYQGTDLNGPITCNAWFYPSEVLT